MKDKGIKNLQIKIFHNLNCYKVLMKQREAVLTALQQISNETLNSIYPSNVFGYEMTTEYFLVHLYGHLDYHLGQINYHRRLLNK
jgi:uncharacterized damage-inducible protein DinB